MRKHEDAGQRYTSEHTHVSTVSRGGRAVSSGATLYPTDKCIDYGFPVVDHEPQSSDECEAEDPPSSTKSDDLWPTSAMREEGRSSRIIRESIRCRCEGALLEHVSGQSKVGKTKRFYFHDDAPSTAPSRSGCMAQSTWSLRRPAMMQNVHEVYPNDSGAP